MPIFAQSSKIFLKVAKGGINIFTWRKATTIIFLAILISLCGRAPAEAGIFNISTEEEINIGRSVADSLESQYGLVDDDDMQERVARIGNRIVANSDRKGLPYTFKVLNSKEINAVACPGGFIYIFKGLIDYMTTDDELAGIIGHEVGHVVKRHSIKQMEKQMGQTLLFGALFGTKGLFLQNIALEAIMAGYSREDEKEADYMGFIHTMRAGYNPYSMLMGLQKLSELKHEKGNWFSSHPDPEARVALIQGYINGAQVRPQVVQKDKAVQIIDAGLTLPPLAATFNGYKPLYRAEFIAGRLYDLRKAGDLNGDLFILTDDGTYLTVLYDDKEVVVLTPQDAATNNTTLADLGSTYVNGLKAWANSKSTKP